MQVRHLILPSLPSLSQSLRPSLGAANLDVRALGASAAERAAARFASISRVKVLMTGTGWSPTRTCPHGGQPHG
jgi:hypothetical protein